MFTCGVQASSSFRSAASSSCSRRATLAGVVWLAAQSTAGQQSPPAAPFPPYRATHMADGHPDLNGIWQAFVTANIDVQDHEAQPGPHPETAGRVRRRAARTEHRRRRRDPVSAVGAGQEEGELRQADDGRRQQRQDVARARRSGAEVLHARRAARDLHAVSVSDRPGHRARTSSSRTRSRAPRAPFA